jgi:hypothetical protein
MASRTIEVEIVADTRQFRRALAMARLSLERSWLRRMLIRLEIWRIDREEAP